MNQDAKNLFLESLGQENQTEPRLTPTKPVATPRHNNIYLGSRFNGATRVTINGEPLPKCPIQFPALDFDWGYCGKMCAHLAYAILRSEYNQEETERLYQTFMREVVSTLDETGWMMTSDSIRNSFITNPKKGPSCPPANKPN